MSITWVEVADTAIKIGFGAIVAAISGYVVLLKGQSHELEKDRRSRYYSLQEEKKAKYVVFLTQSQLLIQTHINKNADLESEAYLNYLRSFNEIQILVGDELRKLAYDVYTSVTEYIVCNKQSQVQEVAKNYKSEALSKIGKFQKLAQLDVATPTI